MGIQRLGKQSGGGTDWTKYKTLTSNSMLEGIAFTTNENKILFSVTGEGIVTDIQSFINTSNAHIVLEVDGVELLTTNSKTSGTGNKRVYISGYYAPGQTPQSDIVHISSPIAFKQSFKVKAYAPAAVSNITTGANVTYQIKG